MPSFLDTARQLGVNNGIGVDLKPLPVGPRAATFAPPTGVNTGQPGRPPTRTDPAAAAVQGPGTIAAPPNITAITDPRRFQQGMNPGGGGGGQMPQPAPQPGMQPGAQPPQPEQGAPSRPQDPMAAFGQFLPTPQVAFDPIKGEWRLPDGTTRPLGTGGY